VAPVVVLTATTVGWVAWRTNRDPSTGLFNCGALSVQRRWMIDTTRGELRHSSLPEQVRGIAPDSG
jgi:hypothetical protein